ncbi:MAG: hypothetical protein AAF514_18575, partial [Verrucomicrobiota bacterium]
VTAKGTVHLIDLESRSLIGASESHTGPVEWLAIRRDDRVVASGSVDGTIRVVSMADATPVLKPLAHRGKSEGVSVQGAFVGENRVVTFRKDSEEVRVWDLQSGEEAREPIENPAEVRSLDVSPDGSLLLTGGSDRFCRLWDLEGGSLIAPPFDLGGSVDAVAFSKTNSRFLAATGPQFRIFDFAGQWEIPDGYLDFVEAYIGSRVNERSVIVKARGPAWPELRKELPGAAVPTEAGRLALWLLDSENADRRWSPFNGDENDDELDVGIENVSEFIEYLDEDGEE